ncbi:hypothetical protein M0208_06665 [Sphingomonas sp. SUN019]|nr:hypothetical protein [Sphingomonas sp. SUN019]UVO50219.1 hypothetical protein M0208_06665 [Sphingomonas sp. SUN019]
MVAVIEPVLGRVAVFIFYRRIVVVEQYVVQAPQSPQHRCHPTGDDIDAALFLGRVQAAEIAPGQTCQVLRVGQLPRQEAAVLLHARHRIGAEAPLLGFVQPRDLLRNRFPTVLVVTPLLVRRAVALGVKIILLRLASHADTSTLIGVQSRLQKSAKSPLPFVGNGLLHLDVQLLACASDLAVLAIGDFAFGLAVRFESAPLVEVKQCAADLVRGQRRVERLGAQHIRIERGDQLRLVGIGGHQAVRDQRLQKRRAPSDIPIPPPPRRARLATIDRQRRAGLRIAPVGKDAHADVDDSRIVLGQAPPDAVRADIQTKPPHTSPNFSFCSIRQIRVGSLRKQLTSGPFRQIVMKFRNRRPAVNKQFDCTK